MRGFGQAMMRPGLRAQLKHWAKIASTIPLPTRGDNVFIFSAPRSGSTWLMELVLTQPGFRACNQPLDIRNPYVRRHLGIADWTGLYQDEAVGALRPYVQKICDGRIRGLATLGSRNGLVSRRLVFKIQNGWQERVAWLQATFGGRVVLLIRHPIAVTVSRKALPRLEAFVASDYARRFSDDVLRLAREIIATGTFFERGILHWCFEYAVPLRSVAGTDWIVVSYEQLVTEPGPVTDHLARRLGLPDVERMRKRLNVPSRTISKSSLETRTLLGAGAREALVGKWRRQVSDADERRAFEIVRAFGIDAYACGRDMPDAHYMIAAQAARR